MISVTTDSVPERERVEFWADLVSRHVTPIRIEPSGTHSVHGEIRAHAIGALGVAQVSGMGVLASHTRAHIARATDHVYAACVHVDGEARLTRRSETIALRPGDVFLTDSRHPFTFDLERRWRHLVVTMPVHWLDGRVARPEALAGAVLRPSARPPLGTPPGCGRCGRRAALGDREGDLRATIRRIVGRVARRVAPPWPHALGGGTRRDLRQRLPHHRPGVRRPRSDAGRHRARRRGVEPHAGASVRRARTTTCRISGVSPPARCTQHHPSGGAGRCEARGQTNGAAHGRRRARETGPLEDVSGDRAIDDAEHVREHVRVGGEQESQRKGQREYPLTQRLFGEHLVDEKRCGLRHSSRAAARARSAPFTAERDEFLGVAYVACHTQEAMLE